ncbi:MAG: lipoate--protein ligase family protein [Synergistaceae bacterium]|nr:lipoate--protein ligase family protein [Synergistaceae bacterium]
MRFIDSHNTNPEYNLAFEKSLCNSSLLTPDSSPIFMLWRNEPSVIVGRFGNVGDEVNLEFAASHNIRVVRRCSGGGAVYHDLGNVNYSFITKDGKFFTLEYFSNIIMESLSAIGLNAALSFSHNDIKANGLKVSGAAQYHHDGTMIHHGTLLFDSELAIIPKVLKRAGRVANIRPLLKHDMTVNEFIDAIRREIIFNDRFSR